MTKAVKEVFILEDAHEFDKAFNAYSDLYNGNKKDYEIWKHFYFFLWIAIEDAPSNFQEKVDLGRLLQLMYEEGRRNFADLADFNFIAGYTVSIFPYEYGDYEDLENEGQEMLRKAYRLEPDNIIYKLVYLGCNPPDGRGGYKEVRAAAAPIVSKVFSGAGALNKYFREVLSDRN